MILSLLKLKLKSQQRRRRPLPAGTAQTHSDASQVGCHPGETAAAGLFIEGPRGGFTCLAFDKHINPKVYSPSTMEDGFCKMCMGRLDHMNDESMYSAEAELCSFMWCQTPGRSGAFFGARNSLEVKLTY